MYYGNSGAANQQNATNVWDSNFKAVYHLKESSGGTGAIKDSTLNANHATDYNSPTFGASGQIGGCVDFNGTSHRIDSVTSNSLNIITNTITLSAWVRAQNTGLAQILLAKPAATGSHNSPYFQYSIHLLYNYDPSSSIPRIWLDLDGNGISVQSSITIATNTWHLITGTYNGTTMRIYMDGVDRGSGSFNNNIRSHSTPLRLGANGLPGEFLKHNLDEVRVADVCRSAAWVAAEYTNQVSPSTFCSVGSESNAPPTKLAITTVNGGSNPTAGTAFSVVVQAQDTNNNPANVTTNTGVSLSRNTGSGTVGGTVTGTITAGTNTVTINGVTYNKAESGVSLTATRTSGNTLTAGNSSSFTVLNGPPVANPDSIVRFATNGTKVATGVLLSNDTDPDGDSLSVTNVSATSTNGGTVSQRGNWIFYTPLTGFKCARLGPEPSTPVRWRETCAAAASRVRCGSDNPG